ncbi:MAG: hypothetical protein J6V09_01150 [Clostridia bacterium]|nr:hypothetical protein [Clostridia bacterium]
MYTYSITPLIKNKVKEMCEDIAYQYKSGISTCPLFSMSLSPEGNPVWDKADRLCKIYAEYKKILDGKGIPTGVLIQSSLGHGRADTTMHPFQRYVNLTNGQMTPVCCPEDPAFIEHFCGVVRRVASERPSAIMLDDDFRLTMRGGKGCACPRHMAEFNKRAGTNMTREELYEHIISHPDDDRLTRIFVDTQRDSLVKAATKFREVIDSIDPTIQGINCTSGDQCESAIYTNPAFAGKGNPTIVRVPNGIYAPLTQKGFSDVIRRAAVCAAKLKAHGIDVVLAETDTLPFNRYGKSARFLHAHYALSLLEGLEGAKHWITRMGAYEPECGVAYRDILAKHAGFYEKIAELAKNIRWVGVNSRFIEQKHHLYHTDTPKYYHANDWVSYVFERIGIPFFFSDKSGGASFIEKTLLRDMTDEEIEELFRGPVFMDSESAEWLKKRGFERLSGVTVHPWELGLVNEEVFSENVDLSCQKQKDHKLLKIINDAVRVESHNCYFDDGVANYLSPAVTVLDRGEGKLSVVFCGTPTAEFDYKEGFSFLNSIRRNQLISLLKEANSLPVYYEGDNEICMKAGYLASGELLVSCLDLGFDPMDTLELYLEKAPKSVEIINPDGSCSKVKFENIGNNVYSIKSKIEPLYPTVLVIK